MADFPKTCSCGREHTKEAWGGLERLPDWHLPWGEVQELRNCACGSTMALVIVEGEPEDPVEEELVEPTTRFERV